MSNHIHYPPEWESWKVSLCHDWLTGMRGGERVLELLANGFPDAPIYTLIHNRQAISDAINTHSIHTSFLQKLPGIMARYRNFLPVMPLALKGLRPQESDFLLSCSHCVAKSVHVPASTRHVCYCFTPMRYAWLFHEEYFPNPIKRTLLNPLLASLRDWDRRTADRVDTFIAISEHVRVRIKSFYGRDSEIVYPPTDTEFFCLDEVERQEYDFIISAIVPYKKVDLAVRAYTKSGFPLKIMGSGSGLTELKKIAGPNIEFLGRQPDEVLRHHYRTCRFLIFPGEEDYGIVPVEAMACGTPVVAYGKGGVTETVKHGTSGWHFHQQSEGDLLAALDEAAAVKWDHTAIRDHSLQFSAQAFVDGIARILRNERQ